MKAMQWFLTIIVVGILSLGLLQCSSQKLVTKPPFVLGEVVAEDWIAGVEGGGSGTNLFIPVESGRDILLDSVYFRNKVVKPKRIQRDNYLVYIGRFKKSSNQPKDMILHEDPKKEFGNTPPELKTTIPFSLKANEAVVSFSEKGKTKYYKIEGIKESVPVKPPKTNPQKGQ